MSRYQKGYFKGTHHRSQYNTIKHNSISLIQIQQNLEGKTTTSKHTQIHKPSLLPFQQELYDLLQQQSYNSGNIEQLQHYTAKDDTIIEIITSYT